MTVSFASSFARTSLLAALFVGGASIDSNNSANADDGGGKLGAAVSTQIVRRDSIASLGSVASLNRLPGKPSRPLLMTLPANGNLIREIAASEGPILLDFYANWCAPCRLQTHILNGMRVSIGGNARIVKINVDHHPELARRFSVRSLPTLITVKQGLITNRHVGIANEQQISQWLR